MACNSAEDLRLKAFLLEIANMNEKQMILEEDGNNSRHKVTATKVNNIDMKYRPLIGASPKIFLHLGPNDKIYYTDKIPINRPFNDRLRKLEKDAKHLQYLMACLSTLGGSNHLCNKPKAALLLARQQELLGYKMGSVELILRARVFQAVNYATMGYRKFAFAMLKNTKLLARQEKRQNSYDFVVNMRRWLIRELPLITSDFANLVANEKVEKDGRDPLALLLNYNYNPKRMECY